MYFIRKKKTSPIFFVIHGLPMGGAEKFLISLVNHVQTRLGNAVLILLGGESTLIKEVHKNTEVITLRKRNRLDIGMITNLARLYRQKKPSKVFCINAYSFFISKIASIGTGNISFYLSPHTTVAFSTKNDILSRVFFSVFRKNDTAIFLCQFQKRYMRRRYLSDRGNSIVIYNGIDTAYFNPKCISSGTTKEIRNVFEINENEYLILSVARISKEKGHNDAILALSMLHEVYGINAHLVFVGDGDSQLIQTLEKEIKIKGLSKYVHFAGQQNDVRPYYKACDIFTLASTSETFSLSALEAMSFGKACVLTEVGGAREMIESNINGLLAKAIDPASIARAWNHLLSRPLLDQHEIRKEVKMKFDIKKMLDAYMNILGNKEKRTNKFLTRQ